MRKGVSFTLTIVVLSLVLLITAVTVLVGSGGAMGDFFRTVNAQTDERSQELDSGISDGGDDGEDGGDGGGGGDKYPYEETDVKICYDDHHEATCTEITIKENGYDCHGELEKDEDGDPILTEVPDGYFCQWNMEEDETEYIEE